MMAEQIARLNRQQSGQEIAHAAVLALTAAWAEDEPGNCQMFARQVAEHVGGAVGRAMDTHRTGTAWGTARNFRGTPYCVWERGSGQPMPPLQDGDMLYKDPEASGFWAGHVGTAVNGQHVGLPGTVVVVCENSHYHTNHGENIPHNHNAKNGKGWRDLATFGTFTMIVRLTQ